MTPMHIAAYTGNTFQLAFLKEKGCNIDSLDNYGNTPLNWAITKR